MTTASDTARPAAGGAQGAALPPVVLLAAISALGPIMMNGVLPANSAIMAEFETAYASVQLVLTVYLGAILIGQVLAGHLADSIGRRPVMIASLAIMTGGSVLCALAPDIVFLLIARFVQGLGAAVCIFLPRTMVRDVYGRDRATRLIAWLTTAMMIAPLFGPAAGGWITDTWTWRAMYAVLAVYGGVVVFACLRWLNETGTPREAGTGSSLRTSASVLLTQRDFIGLTLMMVGSVGIYYCFLAGSPYLVIEHWGYSASRYGQWFMMVAIGYLSGNFVAGYLAERIGTERLIRIALLPGAIGVVLFWVLLGNGDALSLFLPMQLVAFSNGMMLPGVTALIMGVRLELAGTAIGIASSVQVGFGMLATTLLGWLLPQQVVWFEVIASLSAALALLGVLLHLSGGSHAIRTARH